MTISSVDLGDASVAALSPLGTDRVRVASGFWGARQQVNRSVSIPGGAEQLERAGNLHNLRLAGGGAQGTYRMPQGQRLPFLDSDVYKWVEAVGWELGRAPSRALEAVVDGVIALIAAAQGEDGYVNSYWTVVEPERRWQDLANGHELYCAGHLIQAAIAHTRGRGDRTLLQVALGMADHIDHEFGDGRREGVPGHPEIEMALVELSRLTGEARYLQLAAYFVDRRGQGLAGHHRFGATYFQDHQPVREASTVTGHAVRALYLEAGVTDLYLETGGESLLRPLVRRWESMVGTKMYLTGGVGPRHRDEAFGDPYELPPDGAYNETCAAIASVMWSWRLLLATGEARYADLIERTLYNAFLPGFSLDGQRYFYVNTLHARSDPDLIDGDVLDGSSGDGLTGERKAWFGCACCPPNVMRILSSLEHYLATDTADGVQLHQYVAGSISAPRPEGDVELEILTDYPWSGRVDVHVLATPSKDWELSLRVPAWCIEATVAVNGEPTGDPMTTDARRGGYTRINRRWTIGDSVHLELAMPARLTEPHPRIDAVRGCVAIERGPLVYCVESVDLPEGIDLGDIAIPSGAVLGTAAADDLLGGVVAVTAEAVHRPPVSWTEIPYRQLDHREADPARVLELRAVPYYAWGNRGSGPMRAWIPRG